MTKKYVLFIILTFFLSKADAQFVGYYNLHDGGVDMPNSSLAVLENNEFYFFYYAGYKSGTWKKTDKNTIELTEIKADSDPLKIYAKGGKITKDLNIIVINLSSSYAMIGFSKDAVIPQEMKPVFNEGVNCLGDHYVITKKKDGNNYLTIAIPANPNFGHEKTTYPYEALTYTFPLDKKYSVFTVIPDPDALQEKLVFSLEKKNEKYRFNDRKYLEKEELTPEILNAVSTVKKTDPGVRDNRDLGELIKSSSDSKTSLNASKTEPYFTKYCPGDEPEIAVAEIENSEKPTPTTRPNGIYAVLNYVKYNYDVSKYILAKEASVTPKDFQSVEKLKPNYGGTELQITFTKAGALKFAAFTKTNVNKPIAIVINKVIVSAPVIQSEISSGKANIAGKFTEKEIDELIKNLKK